MTPKQFMDCILPVPIGENLNAQCWGAEKVRTRDQVNGLEDRMMAEYHGRN